MNDFFSDDKLAEIFSRRPTEGIALFEPQELGWVCPINPSHEITWSEFNYHIWCYKCEKDYFSLLCPKQMNPNTTEEILKTETEKMANEMARWSIDRYRTIGVTRRLRELG